MTYTAVRNEETAPMCEKNSTRNFQPNVKTTVDQLKFVTTRAIAIVPYSCLEFIVISNTFGDLKARGRDPRVNYFILKTHTSIYSFTKPEIN